MTAAPPDPIAIQAGLPPRSVAERGPLPRRAPAASADAPGDARPRLVATVATPARRSDRGRPARSRRPGPPRPARRSARGSRTPPAGIRWPRPRRRRQQRQAQGVGRPRPRRPLEAKVVGQADRQAAAASMRAALPRPPPGRARRPLPPPPRPPRSAGDEPRRDRLGGLPDRVAGGVGPVVDGTDRQLEGEHRRGEEDDPRHVRGGQLREHGGDGRSSADGNGCTSRSRPPAQAMRDAARSPPPARCEVRRRRSRRTLPRGSRRAARGPRGPSPGGP